MDTEQYRKLFSESAVKVKDTESGIDDLVYRLTGLTPAEIRELKERDTANKIELNAGVPICPVCGRKVVKCYVFCPDCGQRLMQ